MQNPTPCAQNFFLIAGPCIIEDLDSTMCIAQELQRITDDLEIPFIFKASFDKANRTSINSYRGPGVEQGLDILHDVKQRLNVAVLTDVHTPEQAYMAGEVVDVIQIPAFLCRQTDMLVAAGETGRIVNIKKGQFLAPGDMQNAVDKVKSTGNHDIWLTERGSTFGYNNLVVDFRGLAIMRAMGAPVVFDATHSIQIPGGQGACSGGNREFIPLMARAATAAGYDGLFFETHPNPDKALCDGPNSIALGDMPDLLAKLKQIRLAAADF